MRFCVFCGSRFGVREEYRQAAVALGECLLKEGIGLVYGGGSVGLIDDGNKIRVQVLERDYKPEVIIIDQSAEAVAAEADDFERIRRRRQDPIHPGLSIAHENGTAGTLGAIVYDTQTAQPYALSNWHVLQGGSGKVGDRILQPGPFDGGSRRKSFLGRLVRSHLGLAGDCAVASIEERGFEESVLEIGVTPSTNIGRAELNDRVIKSGRTTFAGETDPAPQEEHALACSIHSVFEKLGISCNRVAASESDSVS